MSDGRWRYVGTVEAPPWTETRRCAVCGHNRVHHFGATDGQTPPPRLHGCMVWDGSPKDPKAKTCRCSGWEPSAQDD